MELLARERGFSVRSKMTEILMLDLMTREFRKDDSFIPRDSFAVVLQMGLNGSSQKHHLLKESAELHPGAGKRLIVIGWLLVAGNKG